MLTTEEKVIETVLLEYKPLDIEEEFLSHLTDKDDLEYAVRDGVSPELFYTPKNKAAYVFARNYLNETGQPPTDQVLHTEFEFNIVKPQSSIKWVIDKLRERYQRNQVQDLAVTLAQKSDKPGEAMALLTNRVLEIQKNSLSQKHIWSAGDSSLFLSNLQEKIMAGHYQGIPLGFEPLNLFTGGLKPGQLGVLAARPKRMKTFFLLKAFIQQKVAGYKPILFPLENTPEEVMLRISCMISGYPWDLAYRGNIDNKGWDLLQTAWNEFDALGEHWIASPPDEERTVPGLLLQADKLDADSVIISQFYNILPSNDYYLKRPDHEKWASIVSDLKLGANRQGKERPIYIEAQFNREGDRIEDFSDMSLSQLGLTDKMGQVSDIIMALYQNKDMKENQQIQFGIIDSRNTDKRNWYVHTEFRSATRMEMLE